jgi:hypothetical protein
MKKITFAVMALIFLGLVLSACKTPPIEEMQRAEEAVTRAESDANAVTYAGNAIIRARDALTKMHDEAAAKRYDAAKNYAVEAFNNAERAIEDGKLGVVRTRDEASNLINSLQDLFTEISNSIDAARKVENLVLNLNSVVRDFNYAEQVYKEAKQNFQDENYRDAIDNAQLARSTLASITIMVSEAAQDTSRKQ